MGESLDRIVRNYIEILNKNMDKKKSIGYVISEKMSAFLGSWKFIISLIVFLFIWISLNVTAIFVFDNYPFNLLSCAINCFSLFTAPILLMSANKQSEQDRETWKKIEDIEDKLEENEDQQKEDIKEILKLLRDIKSSS